jgi:GTP-binding protein Era
MAERKRPRSEARARTADQPRAASTEAGLAPAAADDGRSRCGFIALIGAPNVGKSTLINALVGSKVAIVSHKVQTTRALLRAIAIAGGSQLIFIDTPGIFAPRRRLDRAMVTNAWAGAHDADIAAVLIDATRGLDEEATAILERLADAKQASILLINKIDLVEKSALLAVASAANARVAFAATFMISALTGDGVADVKRWLAAHVPEGPWHYPEDQLTDAPLRQLAAEITREKLYLRLHQELPYQSTVETDVWKELKDGSTRIEQTIYVERESQRKIVLGKGGQTIKAIGAEARREIAHMIETPVHLFLFVKVRERWGDDPERYREMGLEFPKV